MFIVKLFFVFVAILCLMIEQSQVTGIPRFSRHKNLQTIFMTDGENCYIFRTLDDVKIKIDEYRRSKKPGLFVTDWDTCKIFCPRICRTNINPVCGEYAGFYMPFLNECEMQKSSCINGHAFVKVPNSNCNFFYL